MELISENDLENICGGVSGQGIASAVVAAGTILAVCGLAVYTVLHGDLRVETVIRTPSPITFHTCTTYYPVYSCPCYY